MAMACIKHGSAYNDIYREDKEDNCNFDCKRHQVAAHSLGIFSTHGTGSAVLVAHVGWCPLQPSRVGCNTTDLWSVELFGTLALIDFATYALR